MKRYTLYILYTQIALLLCLASCEKEDDIDKIFTGKTWYMANGMIQGKPISGDYLKRFYESEHLFYISFSTSKVSGTLGANAMFDGKWQADGKRQTITLEIPYTISTQDIFERNVYGVLKKTVRYSGDENIMTLYEDDYNYIGFSAKRSDKSEY